MFRSIHFIIILFHFLVFSNYVQASFPCLFSHGIADTSAQGARYAQGASSFDDTVLDKKTNNKQPTKTNDHLINKSVPRYLFKEKPILFDYPDAGTGWKRFFKVRYASLGQEDEIDLLQEQYNTLVTITSKNNTGIVLMGVSRGAVTAINFTALRQPLFIRALILESPFDSALSLMRHTLRHVPFGKQLAPLFLHISFPRHKQKGGLHPDEMIAKIAHDIPVLLLCSEEDTTIPCALTINLFKKLKESGHPHVYLLVTKHGNHSQILWGPDGEQYQTVVNAFFARYGLPHEADLAQRGEKLLEACR